VAANYLVGCDTSSSTEFNLPEGHAYTILGTYNLTDTTGAVAHRLYRVRNPWGIDVYNGPWCDGSSLWTDAYKAQVPYVYNTNDGAFFIEDKDLVNAFYYYQIGYVHDDYAHSYYSKTNDTGAAATYSFTTTTASQELYVLADLYDSRLYPNGCKNFLTSGNVAVY
jgi:hypothetical protein